MISKIYGNTLTSKQKTNTIKSKNQTNLNFGAISQTFVNGGKTTTKTVVEPGRIMVILRTFFSMAGEKAPCKDLGTTFHLKGDFLNQSSFYRRIFAPEQEESAQKLITAYYSNDPNTMHELTKLEYIYNVPPQGQEAGRRTTTVIENDCNLSTTFRQLEALYGFDVNPSKAPNLKISTADEIILLLKNHLERKTEKGGYPQVRYDCKDRILTFYPNGDSKYPYSFLKVEQKTKSGLISSAFEQIDQKNPKYEEIVVQFVCEKLLELQQLALKKGRNFDMDFVKKAFFKDDF